MREWIIQTIDEYKIIRTHLIRTNLTPQEAVKHLFKNQRLHYSVPQHTKETERDLQSSHQMEQRESKREVV